MEIYLVGGAVRDRLLNIPVYDRDWVVVGATPEAMKAQGFQPVGKDFPVFLHPDTHEEYALARTERKAGKGYQGFEFHTAPDVTLEQDLKRRDLTINAMAEAADGTLIDPYGGRHDLEHRWLRHVSPAFAEDPLRVLRVARFAARFHHLGFQVAPETLDLMGQLCRSDELAALSAERIWKELERALDEPSPQQFFSVLAACGGLDHWLPELKPLFNADTSPEALLRAVDNGSNSSTRLAVLGALLDDDGSAIGQLLDRLKAPKAQREQALQLARYHRLLARYPALGPEQQLALYEGLDLSRRPERLQPFCQGVSALHPDCDTTHMETLRQRIEAIQPRQLVSEGFKGAALGQELRRRRLQQLSQGPATTEGDVQ